MTPKPEPKQEQNQDEREAQQGDQGPTVESGTSTSPFNTPPASPSSEVAEFAKMTAKNPETKRIPVIRDAIPYPGETFIILHKPSNRAIIRCDDGHLHLGDVHDFTSPGETPDSVPIHGHCTDKGGDGESQCQWLCVERKGWLGFRSSTGHYIGMEVYTNNGKAVSYRYAVEAVATRHAVPENFCVRRHPRGGYILMIPDDEGKLRRIEIEACTPRSLVLRENGGALWEFVKVDGICG